MKSIVPYLVFPGTCREAMKFYRECLGGEIVTMISYGESPVPVPEESKDRVFNAEVAAGSVRIKASDDLPGHAVSAGTNFSLYVTFGDAQSKKEAFERLLKGGTVLFPIEDNFGMLKDRYAIQWMVVYDEVDVGRRVCFSSKYGANQLKRPGSHSETCGT